MSCGQIALRELGVEPEVYYASEIDPHAIAQSGTVRRLTPTECARLQTIPEWYEWVVGDSKIYRLLGNGWTMEVIKWILSFLRIDVKTIQS